MLWFDQLQIHGNVFLMRKTFGLVNVTDSFSLSDQCYLNVSQSGGSIRSDCSPYLQVAYRLTLRIESDAKKKGMGIHIEE